MKSRIKKIEKLLQVGKSIITIEYDENLIIKDSNKKIIIKDRKHFENVIAYYKKIDSLIIIDFLPSEHYEYVKESVGD